MVFSSLLFVFLFLALNLVSQAALRGARQKNIAMLLFSLVFFSWAGPRYVVLLLLDTALCWFFAICIEREPQRKRLHLSLCVALVLLVLGIFKYTGFLMGNLQSLFGWPEVIPQIVLPIGISFYTFQLISYVVDVYRGEVRAQKKYWILLLYASLFHQCIAGPIVRYRDVAQDLAKRQVHAEEVSRGISRFTVGLAKKAVLANSVAVLADRWLPMTTEGLAKIPTAGLWLGGLCYMLQIYLDFSAYSDMAIGMGLMCGFHYKENFNYPYIASSVTDFWRRWHISLSTFFRDYVYIPLGGNRRGKGRQLLNLFIVWGLTGLWHGASWNYVLWGLYFFLFLVIEKFLLGEKQQRIPAVLRHLFLLIIVYFCWVIFRFRDAAALGMALRGLFGGGTAAAGMAVGLSLKNNIFLLLVACVACTPLTAKLWQRWKAAAQGDSAFAGNRLLRGAAAVWEVIHPVLLLLLAAMAPRRAAASIIQPVFRASMVVISSSVRDCPSPRRSSTWPPTIPWGPAAWANVAIPRQMRSGGKGAFARVAKAAVSSPSPANTALASPYTLWLVGWPRRKSSSSIQGKSS